MDIFLLILRFALAGVFGIAGITKFFDPAGSEKAFLDFGLPLALAKPMKVLLPAAELTIAVSLLFVSSSWLGALGAATLLLVFSGGMLVQITKGNAPDCHCFGQLHSEPIGVSSIVRNLIMLLGAGVLITSGRGAQGTPIVAAQQDITLLIIGLPIFVVLLCAVLYLKQITQQQVEIMRRIEMLELVSHDGPVERDHAGHPEDGLPIGGIVPEFTGRDVEGFPVSLSDLQRGNEVLFFYVGTNCAPCQALLPDLKRWQKELMGVARMVLISAGSAEENVEKFGDDLAGAMVLQKDKEISERLLARWTPSALLMDGEGRVASHIAAGDTAIRELVDKIRHSSTNGRVHYYTNNEHARVKVGEPVPEISVPDINGKPITRSVFEGKPTLVTFWSTTCPHCVNMLPDLREWDTTKSDDAPNMVIFSDGDPETLTSMGLRSPIVLDEGHKTAAQFGMFGTPSAVLIDEAGKFKSETAIGADNIWSLIGKRKNGKAD